MSAIEMELECGTAPESETRSPIKQTTANPFKPVCNACMVLFQWHELTEVPCTHLYCPDCLKFFFARAIKDETFYPPACCSARIPLRMARKRFSKTFARQWRAKQLELKTRNKTYCHRPACSAFIAPHSIHNGNACCQRCRAVTCAKCKSAWHWGQCAENDDTGFFAFVKTTDFKRCPECKRMVEKNEGCDHIVCRCGNNFCYGCGRNCGLCECEDEEDDEQEMGFPLFD